jgi:hypothetical protein
MNALPQKPSPAVLATRPPATERAVLSLVVPGLGQFAQRRFLAGATQLGTVVAYGAGALVFGDARALAVAVVWNIWSAIDAYRNERS